MRGDAYYAPENARASKHASERFASPVLSISRVVAVVARCVMEDLLLQIVRESNNARLQNLRKSAQEAHGECASRLQRLCDFSLNGRCANYAFFPPEIYRPSFYKRTSNAFASRFAPDVISSVDRLV